MQKCDKCVMKHLATAYGLMQEACAGYPTHAWLALGQLVLAEWESDSGNEIRAVRLVLEEGVLIGHFDSGLILELLDSKILTKNVHQESDSL